MQTLRKDQLHLHTQRMQNKKFMDKQEFEDDVETLDRHDRRYPEVEIADEEEVEREDIAWMHQIEQVGTSLIITVDLFEYSKKGRRCLPQHLKEFGANKKNKE